MEAIDGLLYGLSVAVSPVNLLAALAGVLLGTLVGVLPGIGPVAGSALVLPVTFSLDPVTGVIMLFGIYYGAQYGGSTTSVLLNMPGDSSAVVTAIDGYQLTKKGRAGAVLTIMALGSFIAGTVALVFVVLLSPVLARVGIAFGPTEFFALTAGGLLLLTRLTGGSWGSSLLPMTLGIAFGTVGLEEVTGQSRFTFGFHDLSLGVSIVPVAVGLFGIAELARLASGVSSPSVRRVRLRELLPSRTELRQSLGPWARGTGIGFGMGLLPGPSATMSSFLSYRAEQRFAKNRRKLGTGVIEGVAGPEAANNAASTSAIIPILALGIPFSATLALAIAALIIQGVTPGPLLITQHPDIYWGVIASAYIGNAMLLILNIPMIGVWVSVLRVPTWLLIAVVSVTAAIGAYSVHNNMLDVYLVLAFGVIGYVLAVFNFKLAPMIIGLVLGPQVEEHLREGLFLGQGNPTFFFQSGLALAIWGFVAFVLVAGGVGGWLRRRGAGTGAPPASRKAERVMATQPDD